MKKKCVYCKENITNENELYKAIQKDKHGNIKYYKNGKEQVSNSHIECYKNYIKKISEWKELTNYLESKYFLLTPKQLCVMIKKLASKVDYKTILDCFKYMERDIDKNIKDKNFSNDVALSAYLYAALKNNITTFSARQKKQRLELIQKNYEQSSVNNIEFLDIKQNINVDDIDYDILD